MLAIISAVEEAIKLYDDLVLWFLKVRLWEHAVVKWRFSKQTYSSTKETASSTCLVSCPIFLLDGAWAYSPSLFSRAPGRLLDLTIFSNNRQMTQESQETFPWILLFVLYHSCSTQCKYTCCCTNIKPYTAEYVCGDFDGIPYSGLEYSMLLGCRRLLRSGLRSTCET